MSTDEIVDFVATLNEQQEEEVLSNLNIEEYLLFRDELMKDVEKNKSVFQKVKVNL